MTERIKEASPIALARMTGIFFLLTIVTGVVAEAFISGRLVADDPAVTARNILAHRQLFQGAFSIYMIEMACEIVMTLLFYELLKPVSRGLSLLAAVFDLVGSTVKIMSRLFFIAPLLVLGGGHGLGAFGADQLQALAQLLLRVNDRGAGIALIFFGFASLVQGYLMLRSTFLPRFLGVLSLIGGLGWLTFLSPSLGLKLFVPVALVGLIGSIAIILWFLIVGVNAERWKEEARASYRAERDAVGA
jgi:hypothetical protein